MPEDINEVVKDILKGVCSFRGVVVGENEIEPKLEFNIVNGSVESYRFTLIFRILSSRGTSIDKLARCCHEMDPYPQGQDFEYIVCDDPPISQEVYQEVKEIFNDVEQLLLLHAFTPSLR